MFTFWTYEMETFSHSKVEISLIPFYVGQFRWLTCMFFSLFSSRIAMQNK